MDNTGEIRHADDRDRRGQTVMLRLHRRLNPRSSFVSCLVSLNRLSVGCGTTPRRQSGDFAGF